MNLMEMDRLQVRKSLLKVAFESVCTLVYKDKVIWLASLPKRSLNSIFFMPCMW
jgi:hypothetical protein